MWKENSYYIYMHTGCTPICARKFGFCAAMTQVDNICCVSFQSALLIEINAKIGKTRPPFATTFQRAFIITYHSLHVSALIQAIIR
jgi:hypothetical protein